MQHDGYTFCNEDVGVFGIHRHGPHLAVRLDNLPMWAECLGNFHIPSVEKAGEDPDAIFFRGLAWRLMWAVFWDFKNQRRSWAYEGGDESWKTPQPHHLALLEAFNRANTLMQARREILEAERGVLYTAPGGERVLWAFEDFEMPLENVTGVEDLVSEERWEAGTLCAKKHRVYRLDALN